MLSCAGSTSVLQALSSVCVPALKLVRDRLVRAHQVAPNLKGKMAGGWSMVPVAICLLICMFNGSVPIMIVEGLDSTASSSEGAASQPEDILHHLVDAKQTLVDNIVHKFIPNPTPAPVTEFDVLAFGGDDSIRAVYSSAELYDSLTASWKVTGSMTAARTSFAALKLPNGKVLATGGVSTSASLAIATCEIYDPVTGLWNSTGSFTTARYFHQLLLLPSGLILASGGYGQSQTGSFIALSSSELYNYTTGTWSPTGSMAGLRGQHGMALLPNGNVISAGGYNGSSLLASTEVYTAGTGQWSLVAPMSTARVYFDLLALTDGKVLAAGGQNASSTLASSELFDPATSKWSITGALPLPQEAYGSILLPNGTAFITGGGGSTGLSKISLTYMEAAGVLAPTGGLTTARYMFPIAALGASSVLAAGGKNSTNQPIASAEIFDIASGMWSPTAAMNTPRTDHKMVAL